MSGEFKLKLGDRIVSAPAQSVMFVPRGTAHTFQNVGTEPGVILVGVTPGGPRRCLRNGRVRMLRRSGRSPKSTTWKWWGRRYSKSPFGGPKARAARLSGAPHPPPMRHYGILSSFQWRGRPECSEVPRGVCSWIRRIQRRLLRARADIARPVPHVAEWPFSSFRCDAMTCRLSGQSGHGMSDTALRASRSRRVCDPRSPMAPAAL